MRVPVRRAAHRASADGAVAAGIVTAASAVGAARGAPSTTTCSTSRPRGTESVVWERRILATAGRSGFAALASAGSLEELRAKQEAFARLPVGLRGRLGAPADPGRTSPRSARSSPTSRRWWRRSASAGRRRVDLERLTQALRDSPAPLRPSPASEAPRRRAGGQLRRTAARHRPLVIERCGADRPRRGRGRAHAPAGPALPGLRGQASTAAAQPRTRVRSASPTSTRGVRRKFIELHRPVPHPDPPGGQHLGARGRRALRARAPLGRSRRDRLPGHQLRGDPADGARRTCRARSTRSSWSTGADLLDAAPRARDAARAAAARARACCGRSGSCELFDLKFNAGQRLRAAPDHRDRRRVRAQRRDALHGGPRARRPAGLAQHGHGACWSTGSRPSSASAA